MKDQADKTTVDLFQEEKRRGRPVTGKAKTDKQRMREYRQRRKEQGVRVVVQREPLNIDDGYIDGLHDEIRQLRLERDIANSLLSDVCAELKEFKQQIALNKS